jgi:hypothetical protein
MVSFHFRPRHLTAGMSGYSLPEEYVSYFVIVGIQRSYTIAEYIDSGR